MNSPHTPRYIADVDFTTRREILELVDGRRLEVRVSGPEEGPPLIFHHGTPGAAVANRALERAAHRRGLRLVTMSRPGYAASTRQRGRRVVDVVADTSHVLSWLGSTRCLVAGWSGGGPHALACAARLEGVAGALVIAGVAPSDAPGLDWLGGMGQDNLDEFAAARDGEAPLRRFLERFEEPFKHISADQIVESMRSILPAPDQAVITDEFGEDLAAQFNAALGTGVEGWLDDDLAFTRPWGFDVDEVRVATMIWQGEEDLMVPFAHGQWLGGHIEGVHTHLLPGEGHLTIAIGALDQMLDELVLHANIT